MDNNQIPMQPAPAQPMPGQPMPAGQPNPMTTAPVISNGNTQVPKPKLDVAEIAKTVAIVVLSLVAVTFIGLFIWKTVQYNTISNDVNGQIDKAVAVAVDEKSMAMEEEFLEREKYPYRTFSGPADYGQLTFEYPKTWSVYVAQDATNGGDYSAYFNPIEVNTVSANTINALRLTIRDRDFETVAAEYQKAMDRKDSNLRVESVTFAGITANRYTGTIPGTDLSGYIVIFKIRDKTVVMQTDSTVFEEDFDKLLETIKFNA